MKKYAQIVNNKVHGLFDYEVLPEFDSTIVMVDVTNITPLPSVGDSYDSINFIPPVPPTFDENKTAKIKALQDKFQEQYDTYLASYPQAEVASFEDKKKEAIAYNLDNTTPTPIIDSILVGLGDDKATYINSILAKVQYLAQQEGAMVKTRDAIKACTTQDELDAIAI